MAGRPPAPVCLTSAQTNILESILRKESSVQKLVRRARLILALDASKYNQHAADRAGVTRPTACVWRKRWIAASEKLQAAGATGNGKELVKVIEELLADSPGKGTKPKFSAEQVFEIVTLACEQPEASDRATTHWTHKELRDEVMKREIVESISSRQVGRFLKRSGYQASLVPILAEPKN
jgi:putative transposase